MKISRTVSELWSVRDCKHKISRNNNQRGITLKLGKGGHIFLRATHCHDLHVIPIPIKLHEDIPFRMYENFGNIYYNQRDISWKLRKGEIMNSE